MESTFQSWAHSVSSHFTIVSDVYWCFKISIVLHVFWYPPFSSSYRGKEEDVPIRCYFFNFLILNYLICFYFLVYLFFINFVFIYLLFFLFFKIFFLFKFPSLSLFIYSDTLFIYSKTCSNYSKILFW
jgi:hypothetical protein